MYMPTRPPSAFTDIRTTIVGRIEKPVDGQMRTQTQNGQFLALCRFHLPDRRALPPKSQAPTNARDKNAQLIVVQRLHLPH
jgi:hypothetical protein